MKVTIAGLLVLLAITKVRTYVVDDSEELARYTKAEFSEIEDYSDEDLLDNELQDTMRNLRQKNAKRKLLPKNGDQVCLAGFRKHQNDADCAPREQVVDLLDEIGSIENASDLRPSNVVVKRCTGTCSIRTNCSALQVEDKVIQVLAIANGKTSCRVVTVKEHVSCYCLRMGIRKG